MVYWITEKTGNVFLKREKRNQRKKEVRHWLVTVSWKINTDTWKRENCQWSWKPQGKDTWPQLDRQVLTKLFILTGSEIFVRKNVSGLRLFDHFSSCIKYAQYRLMGTLYSASLRLYCTPSSLSLYFGCASACTAQRTLSPLCYAHSTCTVPTLYGAFFALFQAYISKDFLMLTSLFTSKNNILVLYSVCFSCLTVITFVFERK